ncbi:MAG: long-chain fatty acid--CoA ligase [Holophagaceae bacterium]|nr:long-chain fatty acid--CoA ligase [Holophagaceae bacterium]
MATNLRELLIQRAARLQERPALSAPGWNSLSYAQFRNRVEGVALGLLAQAPPPEALCCATGSPWDWVAEVAAAVSGLSWDPAGAALPPEVLGGPLFNADAGRGPYHERGHHLGEGTPFQGNLTQAELLGQLKALNRRLEWDHETRIILPLAHLGHPLVRAALWSALFAGAHAVLEPPPAASSWDDTPFLGFWPPDPRP